MTMSWDANSVGLAIENDYRWDFMGWDGSAYSLFIGSADDLHDLRTSSVDEYLKIDSASIPMPDALRERVQQINELSSRAKQAANRGDLKAVRECYQEFGKLKNNVPYDVGAVLDEWKGKGYLK